MTESTEAGRALVSPQPCVQCPQPHRIIGQERQVLVQHLLPNVVPRRKRPEYLVGGERLRVGCTRSCGHLAHAQHRPHHLAAGLVHAAGHGADQSLVTEVLMKALQVDLPVNAIVWGSL